MSECSLLWNADFIQLWWTLLHRAKTMMIRIQRFCRKHALRWMTASKPRSQEDFTPEAKCTDSSETPAIPGAIWVAHVLPFLDRVSQNRLCCTCRDIYDTSKEFGFEAAWPQGKFDFKRPIIAVSFSPDSSSLAIVRANSKTILLWNRRQHGLDQFLKGHSGIVSNVSFSPDGLLASCSLTDGTIRLWSKEENTNDSTRQSRGYPEYRCTRQLVLRVFAMRYVKFSPCGEMIAVWGNDRMIRLEKIHSGPPFNVGSVPWRNRLGIRCCDSVVFPKRSLSNVLAYTFNNEHVRLWNWDTKNTVELRDLERTAATGDYDSYITSLALLDVETSDSGGVREYLVVGCRIATLKLWDLTDYSCVRSFQLGNGWSGVTNIVFTEDGKKMACTGEGSQIRIFDVDTAECVATLKNHRDRVGSLSFTSDGGTLASGSCDRTVRLWCLQRFQRGTHL